MWFILVLALFGSSAWSAESSGKFLGASVSGLGKALVRYGFGYGNSSMKKVEPSSITDFDRPRSFWQETDFPFPLSVHLGIRETYDNSINADFYGHGTKPGEAYFTALNLGLKITLPFFFLQPWGGFGVTGGLLAISDPTNRNRDDFGVAFDKITKAVRGTYFHVGADIMFTAGAGLRVGYLQEHIETDRFSNLSDTAVKLTHSMVYFGFCGGLQ